MTLHQFPSPAPHVVSAKERIEKVRKIARDLYDAREEDTNALRDLHVFEALFLSAFRIIQQKHADVRNTGRRTWGEDSCAFEALSNLSYRSEADDLDAVLKSFKLARDDFYNGTVETVATLIAAE